MPHLQTDTEMREVNYYSLNAEKFKAFVRADPNGSEHLFVIFLLLWLVFFIKDHTRLLLTAHGIHITCFNNFYSAIPSRIKYFRQGFDLQKRKWNFDLQASDISKIFLWMAKGSAVYIYGYINIHIVKQSSILRIIAAQSSSQQFLTFVSVSLYSHSKVWETVSKVSNQTKYFVN